MCVCVCVCVCLLVYIAMHACTSYIHTCMHIVVALNIAHNIDNITYQIS